MTDFDTILKSLLTNPVLILPPRKPRSTSLSATISSLQLHPTLEAAMHILNLDLASAHFLVRHMQSPPAYEGMFLHGILHRIEGDYDNARMWYSDVKESEIYQKIWGSDGLTFKEVSHKTGMEGELDAGQKFLITIQKFKESKTEDGDSENLEAESRREIETIIDWCVTKFGKERILDASEVWVKPSDDLRNIGEAQVSGSAGRRKF